MAVNETGKNMGPVRRLFFGANVTLAVLLVVLLVAAANLLAHRYNERKDLSGGLTGFRLSDRTERVVAKAGPITISTVYTSNDPDKNHEDYLPKLRDFCGELERASKQVKIEHLQGTDEQAALRQRISKKFGSATSQHKELTEQALGQWAQLKSAIDHQQKALEQLMAGETWLKSFSTLAAQANELSRQLRNLDSTEKEIKELIEGEALPKYADASRKITTFEDEAKRKLEDYQKWAAEMKKLADALADPNQEFLKLTREHNAEIAGLAKQLTEIIGAPNDPNVPDDPKPVLQQYGGVAKSLADLLFDETARLDEFLKKFPALRGHARWSLRVELGDAGLPIQQVVGMDELLSQVAGQMSQWSQVLRTGLRQDAPKDQLQTLLRQLRASTAEWSKILQMWNQASTAPFAEAGQIDEASSKLLADVGSGEPFKAVIKEMDETAAKIKALPEQKMDEVGERLKQDNIVVVESADEVRILPFEEVWPLTDRNAERFAMADPDKKERQRREFNGDSAICNAMMDMQSDKKLATIIFVSYESQPPPQMRQFQRPLTGPIPLDEMNVVRQRLERANFAVKDWNLAPQQEGPQEPSSPPKPVPEPPKPDEGTEAIYVFLPPAEAPPMNPFMQMPPQKAFGSEELAKVREVLAQPKSKAVFLALAVVPLGNRPEFNYGYAPLLEEVWGIRPEVNLQVLRAIPSAKEVGKFTIDLIQISYLRLNTFTDHPIGKPLRSRRVLSLIACPVKKVKDVPDVKVTPVLEVPKNADGLWAEGDLTPMMKVFSERSKGGLFAPSEKAVLPPFPVILAAENSKTESKIVVMGNGMSFVGDYLERPVPRLEKEGEITFSADPPPTENAELFANTLYWLAGKPDLIGAGPADVPFVGPIAESTERNLWFITMGWAMAVLVAGAAVMFVRRK